MSSQVSDNSAFEMRARLYLEAVLAAGALGAGASDPSDGIFQLVPSEVFRLIPPLALGRGPVDARPLAAATTLIAMRRDCADFVLAGLQRILLRFGDSPLLTQELSEPMTDAVKRFCYWYDQPGIAGMCFHTENHQILFHACEILAGQQFPEHIFVNSGLTGRRHSEVGAERALRWMDERARFGFTEWLSCYFEEDLLALLNLYDFAADPSLRLRAGMLVDMILFEIALYAHHGTLGTTHGRTYAEYVKGGRQDPVSAIAWLVFGEGTPTNRPNLALTALSTSGYRCPPVILAIAADRAPERICRARCGLSVAGASAMGIRPDALKDQMFFWACQTARHPLARSTARRLAEDAEDTWLVDFIDTADALLPKSRAVITSGGSEFDGDAVNTALAPVDIYAFRTPDYVLSCAQDFRPGRPGYQQHIWQATLDADAVVFTNHPGSASQSSAHTERPNFWAGNRFLPRAAQWRNVVICVHHLPEDDPFPFSHAYFPRAAFDEVRIEGNWVLGRKGAGYIALYSRHLADWAADEVELRADSADNIWICEMGSESIWETFDRFCTAISSSTVSGTGLDISYSSPSVGTVHFGWTGGLEIDGETVPLHDYARYDNPYCHAAIGDRQFSIGYEDAHVYWDFAQRTLPSGHSFQNA